MTITINDTEFVLHPCGAMLWKNRKMLLISDVHLGKIAHFRKHGLAVPADAIPENFRRLDNIVAHFDPETIVFLGDLFHSQINNEWHFFEDWVKRNTAQIILVEGNHDIISKQYYHNLQIEIHSQLILDGFILTHKPDDSTGLFNFCGHIHPGIKLRDVGRMSLKLACFFQKGNQLILPAFGEFTGNHYMKPKENDRVYALANDRVIQVF